MEEHRFCYPTVIPLQPGATAHGRWDDGVGLDAAKVRAAGPAQARSSAAAHLGSAAVAQPTGADHVRPSTAGQLARSTVLSPWSRHTFGWPSVVTAKHGSV